MKKMSKYFKPIDKDGRLDKLHLFLITAFISIVVLYYIDDNILIKPELSTQELIQQGRDLELMEIYSPCELKKVVDNNEYNFSDLSETMQELYYIITDCG